MSKKYGDIYFSAENGVEETRHTFLEGVSFRQLCRERQHLTIGELGFGTGLTFLECWAAWKEHKCRNSTMNYVSVEGYPMNIDDLKRAHRQFPQHAKKCADIQNSWPGAVAGSHCLSFEGGRVRLLLLVGDVLSVLKGRDFLADAWFLDGFSPAMNPEMWTDEVMRETARLSKDRDARLATFTAAGKVRRALARAGWDIEKRKGYGRKRECVRGSRREKASDVSTPRSPPWFSLGEPLGRDSRIVIVGDGVASWMLRRELLRDGRPNVAEIVTISMKVPWKASELPRALVAPKLTLGEDAYSRFNRQSYTTAVRELEAMRDDNVCGGDRVRGLFMPHRDDARCVVRHREIVEKLRWPTKDLRVVSEAEATALLGVPAESGGLWLSRACSIDPERLKEALLPTGTAAVRTRHVDAEVAEIRESASGLDVLDSSGNVVFAGADCVVVAAGAYSPSLLPIETFQSSSMKTDSVPAIRTSAGVVAVSKSGHAAAPSIMRERSVGGGYATSVDADGTFVVGAESFRWTQEKLRDGVPIPMTNASTLADRAAEIREGARDSSPAFWSGVRCDTNDHLPVVGPVQDPKRMRVMFGECLKKGIVPRNCNGAIESPFVKGLYVFTGLGARGFQSSFVLCQHLAATLLGRPTPLDRSITESIHPARFQVRGLKRGLWDDAL